MLAPSVILGNYHQDNRGKVSFVNDFDMTLVKRFYQIRQPYIEVIRAWQGHQKESKWFYCIQGNFTINYVKPENWSFPTGSEQIVSLKLDEAHPCVLYIPAGFVTGIKSDATNAVLMIYSDCTLDESIADDFRFDIKTWAFKI